MSDKKTIVIFGSSEPEPDSDEYQQALELGRLLAGEGYRIANGGYGGIMAATAQGAKEAGGQTIGVTCEAFGRAGANPWTDEKITTTELSQRLQTLINLGDAYIVLPGSTGTLLELAACWEMINKHFLPMRPILCVGPYWKPVIDVITGYHAENGSCIKYVKSLETIIPLLKKLFNPTEKLSI
ncbi:MAG: LOG family protein [Sedimentisphaerales bacterium]|nr:LOG family protein [Sedimentisphaerales bacterium]